MSLGVASQTALPGLGGGLTPAGVPDGVTPRKMLRGKQNAMDDSVGQLLNSSWLLACFQRRAHGSESNPNSSEGSGKLFLLPETYRLCGHSFSTRG